MATEATSQATEQKVTFTPEQQARVDEIVRESMGRAAADVRAERDRLATEKTQLEADLAAAKAVQKAATTPAEKKAAKDDVEALQAQIAEMKNAGQLQLQELERMRKQNADKDTEVKSAKAEALNIRKQNAMQTAASKAGFVDVDMVSTLTDKQVKFDETRGKFIVTDKETGAERLNSAYEPMTLDEFYKEYAEKNPFLVRGDVKGGSGSTQSQRSSAGQGKYEAAQIFGKSSNAALANKLAKENPNEYHRLKAQARESGLIG